MNRGRLALLAAGAVIATGLAVVATPAGADAPRPGAPWPVRTLDIGQQMGCVVLDDGSVKCWGSGGVGQLGQGNIANIGDAPNQMGNSLPPVNLGAGRTATAVTAGGGHTCASLDNATVKCWGNGNVGQLGQGSIANIGDAPNEMGDSLVPIALGAGTGALVVAVAVAPAAPTGLAGTAGVSSVSLAWAAPGDNGGAPVSGYRIEVSGDSITWATAVANTGSLATSRTIGGLTPGQPLRFRVAAINSRGVGVASSQSNQVVPTTAPPSGYVSLDPVRLLDTRSDGATVDGLFRAGGKLAGGQEIALQVGGRGGVPGGAGAVVLNVTVTEPDAAGFLTVYPCGTPRPNASNLNFSVAQTIPNNVIVKVGTGGTVCLFTQSTTHLIADINGAFP